MVSDDTITENAQILKAYIESLKDYIKVITTIGDYVVHKSLSSITEELPQSNFMRVHRSYTISINKIDAIDV